MRPQLEAGLLELGPCIEGPDPWSSHLQGHPLHPPMVLLEVLLVAHHPHWCHPYHLYQAVLPERMSQKSWGVQLSNVIHSLDLEIASPLDQQSAPL